MTYYAYRPDSNGFAGVGFASGDEQRIVQVHYGDTPLGETWLAPTAHGFDDNPTTEGDFPSLSNFWRVPVMSQRAWDALHALIGECSEALPIVHPSGKPYFIIHAMETIDALDCAKSELTRNATTGRVNRIYRYSLRHDLLVGKHIFKLPPESGGELIVDDEFRQVVERSGLKGLVFRELAMAD